MLAAGQHNASSEIQFVGDFGLEVPARLVGAREGARELRIEQIIGTDIETQTLQRALIRFIGSENTVHLISVPFLCRVSGIVKLGSENPPPADNRTDLRQ